MEPSTPIARHLQNARVHMRKNPDLYGDPDQMSDLEVIAAMKEYENFVPNEVEQVNNVYYLPSAKRETKVSLFESIAANEGFSEEENAQIQGFFQQIQNYGYNAGKSAADAGQGEPKVNYKSFPEAIGWTYEELVAELSKNQGGKGVKHTLKRLTDMYNQSMAQGYADNHNYYDEPDFQTTEFRGQEAQPEETVTYGQPVEDWVRNKALGINEASCRVCASCNSILGDSEIKMSKELLPDYSCHKCAHKVAILGLPKAPKTPVGWGMLVMKVGNALRKSQCPACQTDVFGNRALDAISKLGCPVCGNTGTTEGIKTTFGDALTNINEFIEWAQAKIEEIQAGRQEIAPAEAPAEISSGQGYDELDDIDSLLFD
jgi:hypothetical protein